MRDLKLDRRRMLSGGLALSSLCMMSAPSGASPPAATETAEFMKISTVNDEGIFGSEVAEQEALHASRLPSFFSAPHLAPIRADSLPETGISWMIWRHAKSPVGTTR